LRLGTSRLLLRLAASSPFNTLRGSAIRSRIVIWLNRLSRASSSTGKNFLMTEPSLLRVLLVLLVRRAAVGRTLGEEVPAEPIEPGPAMPPASTMITSSFAW
jgi:hypothetical protein